MIPSKTCRRCGVPIREIAGRGLCRDCFTEYAEEDLSEARRLSHGRGRRGRKLADPPEGLDPDDLARDADEGWPYDDGDDDDVR